MKKEYTKPEAEKVEFDYTENVTASNENNGWVRDSNCWWHDANGICKND